MYNWQDIVSIMAQEANTIRNIDRELGVKWRASDDENVKVAITAERDLGFWIIREMDSYPVHPVIEAAIKLVSPYNWHKLLLEHPHVAQDQSKIAFTQNEEKGRKNIQTVTSIGKYITRHFPLPAHIIRDLVAHYGSAAHFQFVRTTAEMLDHLRKGPKSCMVWNAGAGVRCMDGESRHPYEVYDPEYGWHMAVRIEGGETVGRALCMISPNDGEKYYVRSYAKPNGDGYSEADHGLESWLHEQGYHKRKSWQEGERLAYHETDNYFLAPYLDGEEKHVTIEDGCIVMTKKGNYICDQTDGRPFGDFFACENCDDLTNDDDGHWVGRHGDIHICHSCLRRNYTYVYGIRSNQYYVHQDNAVKYNGEYYDEDYLMDNGIVELVDGEYASLDESIEINGDWYYEGDERICCTVDTDDFLIKNEGCWKCSASGDWYTDKIEFVEVDGDKYHPNYAPDGYDL